MIVKKNPRAHMTATAIAAGALFSTMSAHAVDWSGYMRGGPAATSVSGKSRQCFGKIGRASCRERV